MSHDVKLILLWIFLCVIIGCMLFAVLQFGRFTTSQFTWVKKLPIEKKVNAVDAGGIISVLAFAAASILGFWLI